MGSACVTFGRGKLTTGILTNNPCSPVAFRVRSLQHTTGATAAQLLELDAATHMHAPAHVQNAEEHTPNAATAARSPSDWPSTTPMSCATSTLAILNKKPMLSRINMSKWVL